MILIAVSRNGWSDVMYGSDFGQLISIMSDLVMEEEHVSITVVSDDGSAVSAEWSDGAAGITVYPQREVKNVE